MPWRMHWRNKGKKMPLGHFSFFVDGTSEVVRTALAPSISVGSDAANQTFFFLFALLILEMLLNFSRLASMYRLLSAA